MTHHQRDLLLIEDSDEHAELALFYISEYRKDIHVIRLADGGAAMRYIEKTSAQPRRFCCDNGEKFPGGTY